MRVAVAAACAALAAVPVTAAAANASGAAGATATVTRSAHVPFENCNARQIVLTVTVPRRAFPPDQAVAYTVRLHNTGSTACGTAPPKGVAPARWSLTVGPCSLLTAVIRNSTGVNVSPGTAVYHCPMERSSVRLGPHSSAQATGSWNQTAASGTSATLRHAPSGTYRLTVDSAVTVPITLAPS